MNLSTAVLALTLASATLAAPDKEDAAVPNPAPTAKSQAEILKIVDSEYEKSPVRSLAPRDKSDDSAISYAEHKRPGKHIFAAWYCPTSGEASCQVFMFEFDAKKAIWTNTKRHRFVGTHDVTVELSRDNKVIIRDTERKEIYAE